MKSKGFLSEDSNNQAALALGNAIEYMKTDEYLKTRDREQIVPTHAKNMQVEKEVPEPDDDIELWRKARLLELKKASSGPSNKTIFPEMTEREFFDGVLQREGGNQKVVLHLCKETFETCKILNKLLENIAMQCASVTFVRINAEKAPFLVQKFDVNVLPTLLLFRDEVCIGRIVGLDQFGGLDVNEEQIRNEIAGWFES